MINYGIYLIYHVTTHVACSYLKQLYNMNGYLGWGNRQICVMQKLRNFFESFEFLLTGMCQGAGVSLRLVSGQDDKS